MYMFIVLLFICILCFLPIKIIPNLSFDSNNSNICIRITGLYGLLNYNYKNTIAASLEEIIAINKNNKRTKSETISLLTELKTFLIKHVKIYDTKISIDVGVDDAFYTAILISLVSILCGSLFSYLNKNMIFNLREMRIIPIYNCMHLSLHTSCIIETKLGYIIIVLIKMLLKKPKRGCESNGTTNTKPHENNNGKY